MAKFAARSARALSGIALLSLAAAGCNSAPETEPGELPDSARAITDKPAYAHARWNFQVADLDTGEVLLSRRPDEMVLTGSTGKQFTIGTLYDTVGPDTRLSTPVYATAAPAGGVVHGDLILVAAGDLTMGGRGAMAGRVDDAFDAEHIDHVYGDIAPTAARVHDDPLAGLDELARQIAASGVTAVTGDVVVDTRLWQTGQGHEGSVPPIFVNDNLLDIDVTPGAVGQPATVALTPATSAYTVAAKVTTTDGATPSNLTVTPDPANPHALVLSGSIPAGKPQLTVYRVPDAAGWARTLFIEALERAHVSVGAPALRADDQTRLPAVATVPTMPKLAALQSPPLREFGSMILRTSYNTGANAMLCLLATRAGSTDCTDGLKTVRAAIDKAGLTSDAVVLTDGEGAYPASATPAQLVAWLRWANAQPWGPALAAGQPILGETGTIAAVGTDSPAKGKIAAKTGTVAVADPVTGRALFNVQSLAGFMTTDGGRRLVFDLSMSGGNYPDVLTGLQQANSDVGMVAADIQQSLSQR